MKHWIQAARLRTLPLSVSGIVLGSFYALSQSLFDYMIFIFALFTTLGLQILSNFANDYGDGVKGTDNEDRIGPKRAIQSGAITPQAMKKAIIFTALLTLISAILLIYLAFRNTNIGYSLFFLILGILAIVASIKYTIGNSAYGYKGFGDVFVFMFFGLVSTLGVYFLYSKQLDFSLFLPATAIGFLSVGVLNLNNMRDEASDKKAGKNTIVVKMGGAKAKIYQYCLTVLAMILAVTFAILCHFQIRQYLFLLAFVPLVKHIITVYKNQEPKLLDSELKKVALSTFALAVLLSLCLNLF